MELSLSIIFEANMNKLILYTTHCPKCTILEKKLNAKNLTYDICENVEVMKALGIQFTPMLAIEDRLLSFSEAVQYINNIEG